MRELKFRIWSKHCKSYLKQYDGVEAIGLLTVGVLNNLYSNPNSSKDDLVFEQYTGLKDKNDIEIYEGDIIFTGESYPTYIIGFNDRTGSYTASGFPINTNVGRHISLHNYEVVGNIHETPELRGY